MRDYTFVTVCIKMHLVLLVCLHVRLVSLLEPPCKRSAPSRKLWGFPEPPEPSLLVGGGLILKRAFDLLFASCIIFLPVHQLRLHIPFTLASYCRRLSNHKNPCEHEHRDSFLYVEPHRHSADLPHFPGSKNGVTLLFTIFTVFFSEVCLAVSQS
jgi:hypothetical protein